VLYDLGRRVQDLRDPRVRSAAALHDREQIAKAHRGPAQRLAIDQERQHLAGRDLAGLDQRRAAPQHEQRADRADAEQEWPHQAADRDQRHVVLERVHVRFFEARDLLFLTGERAHHADAAQGLLHACRKLTERLLRRLAVAE
jgi:hypothetical protein